jgi:signal transduction histidine kinase
VIGRLLFILSFFITTILDGQEYTNDPNKINALKENLLAARANKSNDDIAEAYFKLAEYYQLTINDVEKAFDNYLSARQYYQRTENIQKVKWIDEYVADRYVDLGFFAEAMEIYEKLINFYENQNDKKSYALVVYKASKACRQRGDTEKEIYYQSILKDMFSEVDPSLQVTLKLDQVETYLALRERDSALIRASESAILAAELNNNKALSKALYYIGVINFQKGDREKCLKYLDQSMALLPQQNYSIAKKDLYYAMGRAYEQFGEQGKALKYFKSYVSLNDSILDHNRLATINSLAQRYTTLESKKLLSNIQVEKENALQSSLFKSKMLYFTGGGFILLLAFIFSIIKFYMQKIETEKIINEQQHQIDQQKILDLENKIKINSMQAMILGEEKERERIAKDLHDSLGGLLSTVKLQFENIKTKLNGALNLNQYAQATRLLDVAVNEVRSISKNLQPAALKRYGIVASINDLINRFSGDKMPEIYFQHYDIPEQIDEIVALSIYRVIQELLNNSIKYAQATEILIQLNGEKDEILLQYEDNGNGFDPQSLPKKGMGLENIKSRINYLKGTLSIDSKINEGVSILAKIPLKLGLEVS